MPILYAVLAALTGLSLGGAVDARVGRPAVAITVEAARPVAAASVAAALTAAALRTTPVAPMRIVVRSFRLLSLPLAANPARRRE